MTQAYIKNGYRSVKSTGNFTTGIIFFLVIAVVSLWVRVASLGNTLETKGGKKTAITTVTDLGRCGSQGGDTLSNPYVPPIRCDQGRGSGAGQVPINIQSQHHDVRYTQIGILTKGSLDNPVILPLMGRRTITSRNKWQYYTISSGGGGHLQTKLPVKIKGKSCSGEYGCDEISNGDEIYVEGYKDTFKSTIYESGLFSYMP